MSGDELQVIPEDLAGKANQIRALSFSSMSTQPALITPDALVATGVAITNLSVNAEVLWAYQEFGRLEGLRLAQTLDNVAGAYAEVDDAAGDSIGSTMDVTDSGGIPGMLYPKGIDVPAPPHPPDMPIPKGSLPSDQMLFPPDAQRALEAGDDGDSLTLAAEVLRTNARSLEASAQQFEVNTLVWEGEAADAAYAKFNAYRDWLVSLAGSWGRLAGEADRMVAAHSAAERDNRPIADDFERLQQEVAQNPKNPDNVKKVLQMGELAKQSEEVRNTYSREGWPYQIQPEDPPLPVVSGIPVTVDDHRRARKRLPENGDQWGQGGGTQSPGGVRGGGPQSMPQEPPASPMSVAEQAAQGGEQGSSQGGQQGGGSQGGQQGGGQGGQQGGGSPGGGSTGGMAGTGKGAPKLPTDPRLKPAATGGGAGGGAGGGGGGGVPTMPLQPPVGAETVAPAVAPAVPAAATGGAAGGGGSGGVGGLAPMHGAHGGGSTEKKRNPQLSEDEELYTEARPWTEAVIGNRVRRRGVPDDTKKESQ